MLRYTELGLPIQEMELFTIGMVHDMATEKANDSYKYTRLAAQEDIDKL